MRGTSQNSNGKEMRGREGVVQRASRYRQHEETTNYIKRQGNRCNNGIKHIRHLTNK